MRMELGTASMGSKAGRPKPGFLCRAIWTWTFTAAGLGQVELAAARAEHTQGFHLHSHLYWARDFLFPSCREPQQAHFHFGGWRFGHGLFGGARDAWAGPRRSASDPG